MLDVSWLTTRPAGTPGPLTISGTRMSVSKAVCLPEESVYSPRWKPLSELNTKYVFRARPLARSSFSSSPIMSSTERSSSTRLRNVVVIAS